MIGGALATAVACSLAVATAPSVAATSEPAQGPGNFQLTILHSNDGESQLIGAPADPNYGGVARFATVVDDLRREARGSNREGEVMLSSGDNFLAGPEFQASLDKGPPYYDSIAMRLIGYDASAVGNHEFDFGPDVLAAFIAGFGGQTPFVSANLDVRNEPSLDRLADMDIIVGSTVTETVGQRIGIVGATTPELASISSPRDVIVRQRVRQIVQAEIIRTRVLDVVLDDGQVVVQDGAVVDGPSIAIATNDFSARGGDQYPFRGAPFTTVGKIYQQALAEYIVEPEGLDGLITAAEYPVGGLSAQARP